MKNKQVILLTASAPSSAKKRRQNAGKCFLIDTITFNELEIKFYPILTLNGAL